ncbi:unnamed protein product [Haemonchus placei]|uniref:DUF148 domain-containing protein n=1 Tax=Haemonchus placei TaxID=6290 RepID=A0A0N4W5J7_HAEPC|nr:unnamed protein product [Haemonchus placei]
MFFRMNLLILLFTAVAAAHPHFMWMELFHPPFLMEVSWKAQQEYDEILHNPKLTIAQQKEQIMAWAKKYKVTVREDVTAVHNLTEIMKNQNQTMLQMMEGAPFGKKSYPEIDAFQVFHVLMFAMKEVMRKHGPHGPHPMPHEGPFPFGGFQPWNHPFGNPWNHQWRNPWEHHWENPWKKPWQRGWNNGPFSGWPHFEPEGPWNRGGWQGKRFDSFET